MSVYSKVNTADVSNNIEQNECLLKVNTADVSDNSVTLCFCTVNKRSSSLLQVNTVNVSDDGFILSSRREAIKDTPL